MRRRVWARLEYGEAYRQFERVAGAASPSLRRRVRPRKVDENWLQICQVSVDMGNLETKGLSTASVLLKIAASRVKETTVTWCDTWCEGGMIDSADGVAGEAAVLPCQSEKSPVLRSRAGFQRE